MEIVRQKNVATVIVFPLVDADGDLVSGATSPDSEIDQWADGANPTGFADCTNEATEIGSTGMYYLSLTQTEMNEDYIVVQVKSGTAKTQVILIRTMVGDPLNVAVTDDGTAINVASGIVEAQVKSMDTGVITAGVIATDAIGAAELAADAVTEIQSGLATAAALSTVDDFLDTEIAAIKAKTDNLPATPADEATLTTIASYLDTEVAAIKAKTDNLPADPADASDIAASFTTVNTKLDTIDDFLDTEISALTTNLATANTNINTIDDFLDTEVAAIKAKTDNLPSDPADESSIQAAIAGLNNISAANVLTQVNAALDAASTELSAVPTTTGSLRQFIQFLHAYFRNKKTQTSTTETLYKEDASTSLGTSTLSDNGTTASKGELN